MNAAARITVAGFLTVLVAGCGPASRGHASESGGIGTGAAAARLLAAPARRLGGEIDHVAVRPPTATAPDGLRYGPTVPPTTPGVVGGAVVGALPRLDRGLPRS